MTTPQGDLPDWQTLVTPNILSGAITVQPGGINAPIISSGSPFRVWGLWLSSTFSSNASYVTGLNSLFSEIQDGSGNVLLAIVDTLRTANTVSRGQMTIAVPGFTPMPNAGVWSVNLVSGSSPANTDYHIDGGLYYSQP